LPNAAGKSEMLMYVICPHCGADRDVSGLPAGSVVYCFCGKPFWISEAGEASPAPQAPAVTGQHIPGIAIASFVLSLLGIATWCVTGIPGIILGYKARKKIDSDPLAYTGRGLAVAGIVIGWVTTALFAITATAIIVLLNFMSFKPKAYDASAQWAGYKARIAEEVYYRKSGGDVSGTYTSRLEDLLQRDKNLTDDPEVTFSFGAADSRGYTFTTRHKKGKVTYTWTD
jgi:hypothetical protein